MATSTRIETTEHGLVVVKQATGEAAVERLHREARMLALARHPGVVQMLSFHDLSDSSTEPTAPGVADRGRVPGKDPSATPRELEPLPTRAPRAEPRQPEPRAAMWLEHVGLHTLATLQTQNLEHACALMAAIAETIADLHSIGIVHNCIEPAHILIDSAGRPILTGFAEAALVGDPIVAGSAGGRVTRPSDDLPDLGDVLRRLVGRASDPDPIPDRRFGRSARSRAYIGRSLLNLVDQATIDSASMRPSARSFAAAVRALEPGASFVAPSAIRAGSSTIDAPVVSHEAGRSPSTTPIPVDTSVEAEHSPPSRPRLLFGDQAASHSPSRPAQVSRNASRDRHQRGSSTGFHRNAPFRLFGLDRGVRTPDAARRGVLTAAALVGTALLTFGILSSWNGERPTLAEPNDHVAHGSDLAGKHSAARVGPSGEGHDLPRSTDAGRPEGPAAALPTATPSEPPAPGTLPATDVALCEAPPQPSVPSQPVGACARSVPLDDGVLAANGKRYSVGLPGDEVLVGDWTCNGSPLVALARPTSGEVFLFRGWADRQSTVEAEALATLSPGVHLESGPRLSDTGCPVLVANDPRSGLRPLTIVQGR